MTGIEQGKLRVIVLAPMALVLCILLSVSVVTTYRLQYQDVAKDVESRIKGTKVAFRQELDEDAEQMGVILDLLKGDPAVQKAWLARDREELLAISSSILEKISSKRRVTHFYFMQPDQVCFLRVHHPARHGDIIKRFTMEEAARTEEPAYGIELGPYGTFALRTVHPWRIDGRLVGYIELGEEIEHITLQIAEYLDVDIAVAVKKEHLVREKWEDGQAFLKKEHDWNELDSFAIIDRTMSSLSDVLISHLDALERCDGDDDFVTSHKMTIDERHYYCAFTPLIDVAKKDIGEIIILLDITDQLACLRQAVLTGTATFLYVGGALFVFLAILVGRIEHRLASTRQERERAQAALLKSETRFRTLFETSHDAIMTLAPPSWRFTSGNAATVRMFHAGTEEAFVAAAPWQLSPEFQADGSRSDEKAKEMIETAMRLGDHFFEWRHKRLDGEEFSASVLLTKIALKKQTFLQATVRDISEKISLEKQLRQSQKFESIVSLARGAAHEINNPIMGIMNYAELIKEQAVPNTQTAECAGEIVVESERIAGVIRSLMSISNDSEGVRTSLQLNTLVEAAISPLRETLDRDHISVRIALRENSPVLWGLSGRLQNLLTNVVSNAQDALNERYPGGDTDKIITIDTEQIEKEGMPWLRLNIGDHGHGVPEEINGRIFEPFYTTKDRAAGSGAVGKGMGLATALSIARDHGGDLRAECEPGQHTRFVLELPIYDNAETKERTTETADG